MDDPQGEDRQRELEAMLLDANRQLLGRDQEFFDGARGTILSLERELERRGREIAELNRVIAELHATRAWRLAERYRSLQSLLKKPFPEKE